MLSPRLSDDDSGQLLPEERELLELTGLTEEQYFWFLNQQREAVVQLAESDEPTAFLVVPFLISLVVGAALNYALSVLLAPQQASSKPFRVESTTVEGQSIVNNAKFAPSSGFDSPQNVVEIGSLVPVVFAKRETIDGVTYGGVRVNTNLLWSQLYSLGDSQLYKGLFMVGVAGIGAIDPTQVAIGDNVLTSYDLAPAGNTTSRASIYYQNAGRRLRASDFIAGRIPASDIANSENAGAADLFQIRGPNGLWSNSFCYASAPSNQTVFGLYAPIGNELGIKVNPRVEPMYRGQTQAAGQKFDRTYFVCKIDPQAYLRRIKQNQVYSSRSGFVGVYDNQGGLASTVSGEVRTVLKDQSILFYMSAQADNTSAWSYDSGDQTSTADAVDIAQSIAGRQRSWDESLTLGSLYKCGSVVLVLVGRSPATAPFSSRMDQSPPGGGTDVYYTFKAIKAGVMMFSETAKINRSALSSAAPYRNGTNGSHLYRLAVATFAMARPGQVIEIGYKVSASLRYGGLCNFAASETTTFADNNGCLYYNNIELTRSGRTIQTSQYTSGTIQAPGVRYVVSRLSFRVMGAAEWVEFPHLLVFKGAGGSENRDYIRLQLPSSELYEFSQMPVDGWEVRNGYAQGQLCLIDASQASLQVAYGAGATIEFNGSFLGRNQATFCLPPTQTNKDLGIANYELGDNGIFSYVDAWGCIANIFGHEEISISNSSPECQIAYVNTIEPNLVAPSYAGLTTMGLTLRSSTEFQSAQQVSVYINQGFANTHLIGSVLRILATNSEFGLGERISPTAITASFDEADEWTYANRYFFDGAISEPANFRVKGAELANYFLLELLAKGSQFYLQPIADPAVRYEPMAMYTSGNVFKINFAVFEPEQRTPPIVHVQWRQERQSSTPGNLGLFPVIRQIAVREASTPETAPIITIDATAKFMTSERHAIDLAKMECRKRRIITCGAQLTTRPDAAYFEPGRIVKLAVQLLQATPRSGLIASDGTIILIPAASTGSHLADGSYPMLLWDGIASTISAQTIAVTNGKAANNFGCVFTIADATPSTPTFKIQKVTFDDDGNVEADLTEYPLDQNGYSLLTAGWDVASNWVIDGQLSTNSTIVLEQAFSGVTILGNSSSPLNGSSNFTAQVSGPSGSYTYAWSGSGITIANPNQAATSISFPNDGIRTISLTVTFGGVSRVATKPVQVGSLTGFESVGAVTVTGPAVANAGGASVSYSATTTNALAGTSWEWTVLPPDGATLTANGATATVVFAAGGGGSYTIQARVNNMAALDNLTLGAKSVLVAPSNAIGTASITGPTAPAENVAATYSVSQTGTIAGTVWAWSVSPAGTTISGVTGSGTTASIAFPNADISYTVTATATNGNATDSPQFATLAVKPTPSIGALNIYGSAVVRSGQGGVRLTAVQTGRSPGTTWSWSVSPSAGVTIQPAWGSSGLNNFEPGFGSSCSINFPSTVGVNYEITVVATNANATDATRVATKIVAVAAYNASPFTGGPDVAWPGTLNAQNSFVLAVAPGVPAPFSASAIGNAEFGTPNYPYNTADVSWSVTPSAGVVITNGGTGQYVNITLPDPSIDYVISCFANKTVNGVAALNNGSVISTRIRPSYVLSIPTVSGPTAPQVNVPSTYTASQFGMQAGTSYTWSVTPSGATITGSGTSVSISFPSAGTQYQIQLIAANADATNSPKGNSLYVTPTT